MAKFVLILGGADLDKRSGGGNFGPILERYMAWVRGLSDAGRLLGSYKLDDRHGARLTVRGGEIVDGPFVERKESIGGVLVVDADSLSEASAMARDCPVLGMQNGYVEVRPLER